MRKLMWFSIGFAAACALCAYCLPQHWIVPLIGICFVLGVVTALLRVGRAAFTGFGCALGLIWFLVFQQYYLLPAVSLDGVTAEATVTATDYSNETNYGTAVDGTVELEGKPYQIRLYINEKKELQPGDTISGAFRFRYTPGGEEDAAYHPGKGIFLLGYQRGEVTFVQAVKSGVRYYSAVLAQQIKDILRSLFPEDVFPFTQALLLGDNTELSYETDSSFKISGIRHIIAVSGLHVTILYSLLSAVTFRKRFLTALLSIPTLFLFAGVAGFTPSVTRACIMVGLMIFAQLFKREYDSPTSLAFAALVMLIVNPLVITSISFQLSVGCVAGIQLFYSSINNWLQTRLGDTKGRGVKVALKRWFTNSVAMTLSAMSLTTPLSAYYFGAVSVVGVLTNLLTLWVVNFIFNGLVVVCLLSLLSMQAASFLAGILAWPIRYVLTVAKLLSSIPLASVYTKSPYIVAWLVFVYMLLAIFMLSYKCRPAILSCCAALGLCAALIASWLEPLTDNVRLTMLDVGQGQSLLLQSEGRTYLIDCGGDSDTQAADIAAETLLSQGVFQLDGIILTHGDRDHAGGAANLLTRVKTDMVFIPATTDEISIEADNVIPVDNNIKLNFGSAELTIFGPIYAADENENSLCVLFETESCDILVTGDRGSLGETMLLHENDLPDVDILVAGHHGSKNSTSDALLQAVQPEAVLISAGADNSYGHPAPELLQRLSEYGCQVYRTDRQGTITIRR